MPPGFAHFLAPALSAVLPLRAAGLETVELPTAHLHAHWRALLQVSQNRRAFGSVNHLIIFTGRQHMMGSSKQDLLE
jgi:hypothetical protein